MIFQPVGYNFGNLDVYLQWFQTHHNKSILNSSLDCKLELSIHVCVINDYVSFVAIF